MKEQASTIRPGSTFGELSPTGDMNALERLVAQEWEMEEVPDLVGAIQRHPEVLENRSVLLNLALREYRSFSAGSPVELKAHCRRFRQFGRSVQKSIYRQLETQQYFDKHPDLLALLAEEQWPEVGSRFGEFLLLEQLGSGGSARVYLATQGALGDRRVVVKATPYTSYEASILGRFNHPNIVPIHFAGEVEDECQLSFLCMPYCGRSTLVDLIDLAFDNQLPTRSDVIRRAAMRWLPESERDAEDFKQRSRKPGPPSYVGGVTKLAFQMADALEHAHRRGIFHGDLKPSNVLLTPDGTPLLLDFNLSRQESMPGVLCGGTLAYMPPENLRLIAREESDSSLDASSAAAADIYSFGALLYELLGGRPPVPVPDVREAPDVAARKMLSQLQNPVVSVRKLNPGVSSDLEAIVMRAIAFDASQRPASMAEIKRCLQSELRWRREVRRSMRMHPRLVGTLVILVVTTAAAGGTWLVNRPPAHVAHYQEGLAAAQSSEWQAAEHAFLSALRVDPGFEQAQLELGRVYLADNQLDLALDTLERLSIRHDDNPELMELVGYIYNLKRMPSSAIAWYQRSQDHGGHSLSLYNNLAASYLSGVPKSSSEVRFDRQAEYLDKALEMDAESWVVQLNLVRHQIALANAGLEFDSTTVEPLVRRLSALAEDNSDVREVLARWQAVAPTGMPKAAGSGVSDDQSPMGEFNVAELCGKPYECGLHTLYLRPSLAP